MPPKLDKINANYFSINDAIWYLQDMDPNIFHHMDELHVQQVIDELTDRFGFPEKKWKALWKEYLDKLPRAEDEIGAFLKFGNARINPILNDILIRGEGHGTFNSLCEYVIRKSESYKRKERENKEIRDYYKKRK